jgi:(2Fe-2S) ferredoxin/predicted O-methyltransferase YrrM
MEPLRFHLFACEQQKPEGVPGCAARGAARALDALRKEIAARGLTDEVQITSCGSIGLCDRGPNLIVYPDGVWYSGVQPEDAAEIVESHFQHGRPVARLVNSDAGALAAEVRSNRDKYLAGLRARDAAGAMPDDVMQMIRGYQDSRVVLTAIELDVFTAAGDRATAAEVAQTIGADRRGTEMLLNALVALGLLTKEGGAFAVTPVARRFFTAGGQNDARAATMHTVGQWERWSKLTDAVRAGGDIAGAEIPHRGSDWLQSFIAAMHRNASERGAVVVQAAGAAGVSRMLDVGGGSGAYSIAFARANPQLHAEVFDLENVLPLTRGYIAAAGLESRITTRAGDLRSDDFGSGHDLVFVSAVCHMLSPEENRDLLERCFAAVTPGGRIVINDFILNAEKTAPKAGALFSLNMLVGTRQGASYSEDEYRGWLEEAGFETIERIRVAGPTNLMSGTRR